MTGRRTLGRRAALVATVMVTALLLWLTRARSPGASADGGHDMGAMAAAGGRTERPVTLGDPDQRLIGVTFAAVDSGLLARQVRVVGIVGYDESRLAAVTTRVEGFVERLGLDFTGKQVARGDVLLELYAPAVVAAQEELLVGVRLLADLREATPEARRSAEAMVAASRRRLEAWSVPSDLIATIEASGTAIRTFPLRSPASGFAIEKTVVAGQRVMPGDPLYRLADLATVWIEGDVYERDLAAIRVGDSAEVRFTALPGLVRRGPVSYLYPLVNADTRTARVRIALSNRDLLLKPGMYATLDVATPARPALTIPRSAALVTGQRTLVFLKRPGGRFEPREVTLGPPDDDRYEVLAGLTPGDTVVASGTFLLDAESNLGTMLGGMGGMPGMDLAPARPTPPAAERPAPPATHHR